MTLRIRIYMRNSDGEDGCKADFATIGHDGWHYLTFDVASKSDYTYHISLRLSAVSCCQRRQQAVCVN
jgi:hypothetical protein